MSGTTETATDVDVTDSGLADALAFGWQLLVRVLLAAVLFVWTGFWGNVAYINVTNSSYVGALLTVGLLVGSVALVGLAWRH